MNELHAAEQMRAAEHLAANGQLGPAIDLYQQLLQQAPQLADAWYNLGRLLRRADRPLEALSAYAAALSHGVSEAEEVHLNRAVVFAEDLQRSSAAEHELRVALALNPQYLPALMNLGNLQEDLGDRPAARATYERVLALQPRAHEALARYAQLFKFDDAEHPLIGRLRAALEDPKAGAAERASLGFALARALDEARQYAQAFATASQANQASRSSVAPPASYDRLAQERFTDDIIRAFPAHIQHPSAVEEDAAAAEPIFICGMFRSGSTLTESLLAGHPALRAGGELPLLPHLVQARLPPFPASMAGVTQEDLRAMAAEYRAQLALRFPGAALVTDKRPDNFLYLGLIKRLFPRARIVHTTRDALDTCLSIFFLHLDRGQSYALDLRDIGHYFRQYRRLMAHWHHCFGGDILDFNYDTLVREPRPSLERLLSFLGLPWHEACLDFTARPSGVRTASVWQVREGLYRRASGRARHYARELAPLAAELARTN